MNPVGTGDRTTGEMIGEPLEAEWLVVVEERREPRPAQFWKAPREVRRSAGPRRS
jgi:hypothetical protein